MVDLLMDRLDELERATPDELASAAAWQEAILSYLANQHIGPDKPVRPTVLPSLSSWQKPDIMATEDGTVIVFYSQPIGHDIWWAEYDPDYAQLIFVTTTGQIMPLGSKIHVAVDKYLRLATMISFAQVDENGRIVDAQARKLTVRRNGRV